MIYYFFFQISRYKMLMSLWGMNIWRFSPWAVLCVGIDDAGQLACLPILWWFITLRLLINSCRWITNWLHICIHKPESCRFMVINLSHAGRAVMLAFIPHLLLALAALLQWVCLYWYLEVGKKMTCYINLSEKVALFLKKKRLRKNI